MQDEETLKRILNDVLEERDRLDGVKHAKHHQFIEDLIDERHRKIKHWDNIKSNVWGWSIITATIGIGGAFWITAKHYLKQ